METLTEKIRITTYDTTLRDGAQTPGVHFTVDNKLKIARKLDEIGFPYIEGGWPGANDTDVEFFKQANSLGFKHARLVAFGSTARVDIATENDPGLKALLESSTKTITIFGKSSLRHVKKTLRTTDAKNLQIIYNSIKFLRDEGREVFYDAEHFFDGFKENPNYTLETTNAAKEGGASVIILCDTNGGNLPDFVYNATRAVRQLLGEDFPLGIHVHNDAGLANANTLAAIQAGATQVQGTINGLGERAGNVDLAEFSPLAECIVGLDIGDIDLLRIPDLSKLVELESGILVPYNKPFVGRDVFTHKGGVHVAAEKRDPGAYGTVNPNWVGREARFEHSNQGGSANVEVMLEKHGFELKRDDPRFQEIVKRMKKMDGLGDAQEFLLLHDVSTNKPRPFELLNGTKVTTIRGYPPIALVQVGINGINGERIIRGGINQECAKGNGPIDAFNIGLCKVLGEVDPLINQIKLVNWSQLTTQEFGTGAKVTIRAEFGANGDRWTSVASGTNQQEAGENVLIDAYNFFFLKRQRDFSLAKI